MTRYAKFVTPLGTVLATAEGGFITSVNFVDAKFTPPVARDWEEDPRSSPLRQCREQLADYFAAVRQSFDLPVAPLGTPFQKRVWREIARVPFGETITYSELASRAGAPGSARAAGAATGRNPIAIVVPCHRIVGADGSLTGYAGGLERKARLLEIEGVLQGTLV
jgi:methylated-DNA-[protein]-cysteine S-methyltransferase